MRNSFYNLFFLVIFLFSTLLANKPSDKRVKAYRINEPLKIDGILDEDLYSETPIDEFTQKNPDEGKPATELPHLRLYMKNSTRAITFLVSISVPMYQVWSWF